jgi:hypothetical protein
MQCFVYMYIFVAIFAYQLLTQDNMRQPDVAFYVYMYMNIYILKADLSWVVRLLKQFLHLAQTI